MTAILDPRAALADSPGTATDVPPAEPVGPPARRLRAPARPALVGDLRRATVVAAAGLVLAAGIVTAALLPSPFLVALVTAAVAAGCALIRRRVADSLADLLLRPSPETTRPPQAGLVL